MVVGEAKELGGVFKVPAVGGCEKRLVARLIFDGQEREDAAAAIVDDDEDERIGDVGELGERVEVVEKGLVADQCKRRGFCTLRNADGRCDGNAALR